ncbi:DUF6884 domain-containing protein [Streptosporangium sp. NPDC051022]|uniref:DUF6884 domain-containing protein n=1 Tax=Streptosporangium sp. NPDC051022 TaxID=3155752 RepID=UPI003433AD96
MNLVIVGCSSRKKFTTVPVPALDLYEGGCVPHLRRRVGHLRALRSQVRILSAEYGLVSPDRLLLPYDRRLTSDRARELCPITAAVLEEEFERNGRPVRALVVAEPLYQSIVHAPLREIRLHLIDDPRDWATTSKVLDSWNWP